jgi:cell division protein FtsB
MGLTGYMMIGIGVLVLIFGAYFEYSQHQIKEYINTIALQNVQIASNTVQIKQLEKDAVDIKAANNKLTNIKQKDEAEKARLNNILRKLNSIPTAKANLLQDMINNGVKERLRCLALATGSPPEPLEVNHLCPQLLPEKVLK